jgi:hypothetical protein
MYSVDIIATNSGVLAANIHIEITGGLSLVGFVEGAGVFAAFNPETFFQIAMISLNVPEGGVVITINFEVVEEGAFSIDFIGDEDFKGITRNVSGTVNSSGGNDPALDLSTGFAAFADGQHAFFTQSGGPDFDYKDGMLWVQNRTNDYDAVEFSINCGTGGSGEAARFFGTPNLPNGYYTLEFEMMSLEPTIFQVKTNRDGMWATLAESSSDSTSFSGSVGFNVWDNQILRNQGEVPDCKVMEVNDISGTALITTTGIRFQTDDPIVDYALMSLKIYYGGGAAVLPPLCVACGENPCLCSSGCPTCRNPWNKCGCWWDGWCGGCVDFEWVKESCFIRLDCSDCALSKRRMLMCSMEIIQNGCMVKSTCVHEDCLYNRNIPEYKSCHESTINWTGKYNGICTLCGDEQERNCWSLGEACVTLIWEKENSCNTTGVCITCGMTTWSNCDYEEFDVIDCTTRFVCKRQICDANPKAGGGGGTLCVAEWEWEKRFGVCIGKGVCTVCDTERILDCWSRDGFEWDAAKDEQACPHCEFIYHKFILISVIPATCPTCTEPEDGCVCEELEVKTELENVTAKIFLGAETYDIGDLSLAVEMLEIGGETVLDNANDFLKGLLEYFRSR